MSDPRTDQALVRCDRLDLVEALADDLAHEIKNPLHSIALHLEILRRRMEGASGIDHDEIDRYLGRLTMDVERASGRLEVLLRLARPPRETRTSVNEAVHALEELFRIETKHHKLRLELDLGNVKEPLAPASGLVHQLMLEMMHFAAGRLPEHAAVIVRTAAIDGGARFSVAVDSDGASGLPDDSDAGLEAIRRLARVMDAEVDLVGEEAANEDWSLRARIGLARGTRRPPAGV